MPSFPLTVRARNPARGAAGEDGQPVYGPHGEPVLVGPDGQPMLITTDGEVTPFHR